MNSGSEINVWTQRPKWFGRIDIEEFERLAGIGYTPQQIAMYYDIDVTDFMSFFKSGLMEIEPLCIYGKVGCNP